MPTTTISHAATTSVDPAAVQAVLEQAATWSGLGPIDEVWDETYVEERLASFRWRARAGGRSYTGTASRVETNTDSMVLALDSTEITGEMKITVAPSGGGSSVSVDLTARSKGVLAGMFWGVVSDTLRRGLPRQVDEFVDGL